MESQPTSKDQPVSEKITETITVDALYTAAYIGEKVKAVPSDTPKGPSESDLEALRMAQRNIGKYTGPITPESAAISGLQKSVQIQTMHTTNERL